MSQRQDIISLKRPIWSALLCLALLCAAPVTAQPAKKKTVKTTDAVKKTRDAVSKRARASKRVLASKAAKREDDRARTTRRRASAARVAGEQARAKKRLDMSKLKPATLIVVANFAEADVTVNGIRYPDYTDPDAPQGIVLPAGGPHHVTVTVGGKAHLYKLSLRPYETRYMMVGPGGASGVAPAPRPVIKRSPKILKR